MLSLELDSSNSLITELGIRAFIYLPDLRASLFPKIPAVPSVSVQDMI